MPGKWYDTGFLMKSTERKRRKKGEDLRNGVGAANRSLKSETSEVADLRQRSLSAEYRGLFAVLARGVAFY